MIDLPVIHFDCIHFKGDRPCRPNKDAGIFCDDCSFYEIDETIKEPFPEINEAFLLNAGQNDNKQIIIVKLDAVGDVLRTTSILPSLKKKYPDSDITWITKEKSFPVLQDNELIDEIYFAEEDPENIYAHDFDIAINLDSGFESCEIMNNIIAKECYGYYLANGKPYPFNKQALEWYLMGVDDNRKKKNKKTYHQIIHEICLLEYDNSRPSMRMSKEKKISAELIKKKFGLEKFDKFILINLGGGNRWQYKKWTKEGYAAVVNRLSELNGGFAIGVVAGIEDKEFYNDVLQLTEKNDNVVRFGCKNSMDDFINIVYLADKVLTSDSLAFHIATALDKFVVVLVGPTSHDELDVFGNGKILYSDKVDCLTCYLNRCDKTVTCMNTMEADEILKYLV
jgi:heptosyltransferase-2